MARKTQRQGHKEARCLLLDADRFEICLRHGSGDPLVLPSFADWIEFYAHVDKLDEAVEFMRTKADEHISRQPGFRAMNCVINRMTGRMAIVITWASAEAQAANSQTVTSVREEATRRAGANGVRATETEVVLFHGRTASGEFFEAEQPAVVGG